MANSTQQPFPSLPVNDTTDTTPATQPAATSDNMGTWRGQVVIDVQTNKRPNI